MSDEIQAMSETERRVKLRETVNRLAANVREEKRTISGRLNHECRDLEKYVQVRNELPTLEEADFL